MIKERFLLIIFLFYENKKEDAKSCCFDDML